MPWKWSAPLVQIWQILNITPFSLHFFNPHEPDATLMNKKGKKKHCLRLQVTMMENVMVIYQAFAQEMYIYSNCPEFSLLWSSTAGPYKKCFVDAMVQCCIEW